MSNHFPVGGPGGPDRFILPRPRSFEEMVLDALMFPKPPPTPTPEPYRPTLQDAANDFKWLAEQALRFSDVPGTLIDAYEFGDALGRDQWGAAIPSGAGMMIPFVPGKLVKAGVNKVGDLGRLFKSAFWKVEDAARVAEDAGNEFIYRSITDPFGTRIWRDINVDKMDEARGILQREEDELMELIHSDPIWKRKNLPKPVQARAERIFADTDELFAKNTPNIEELRNLAVDVSAKGETFDFMDVPLDDLEKLKKLARRESDKARDEWFALNWDDPGYLEARARYNQAYNRWNLAWRRFDLKDSIESQKDYGVKLREHLEDKASGKRMFGSPINWHHERDIKRNLENLSDAWDKYLEEGIS